MKRISVILLTALLLLSSCAESVPQTQDTSAPPETTLAASTETEIPAETLRTDKLPAVNYDNLSFHILTAAEQWQRFYVSEQSGDVVSDAVYTRNTAVEDRFGVVLDYNVYNGYMAGMADVQNALRGSVMSGGGDYDLMAGSSSYSVPLITHNLLGDLHGEKYLELSAPWWFQSTNEELQIVGKLPLAAGSFGLTNYAWANVVFFSKELAKDYQVEDLYTIVQNGDWTLDRMFSIASTVRKDLNGDNIYDEHDVLGILSSYDYMAFLADSMGCVYTTKNEDGTVTYNPLSEKLVAINEKLFSVMSGSGESGIGYADSYALKNKYGTPDNYSKMIETFAADQSMFMVHRLEHTDSEAMRNMDGYGIIPAPKYDTEQKNYITATVPELAGIPSVVTDREVSAILLEALQYESWKTVRPAYYDIALKAKYSQDSVTGQMLDLIFENVTCSFAYMFNQVTGGYPSSELGRTQNYASWYTQNSKVWQKKLNIAVKNLQEAE